MTTTTTDVTIAPADVDEPLEACFWCHHNEPTWAIRYDTCRHSHLACDRCQQRIVQRQQVADEATPPRPYATHHVCCGARPIWRATWVRL